MPYRYQPLNLTGNYFLFVASFVGPSVSSTITACSSKIRQLRALGISNLGAPSSTFDLVPPIAKLSTAGVCCSPDLYDSCVEKIKGVSGDEVRLIYWWAVQAASFLSHAGVPCLARPAAWLTDVSLSCHFNRSLSLKFGLGFVGVNVL